jgi:hypothetical protein
LRLGKEGSVGDHGVERRAQRREAIGRDFPRHDEEAAEPFRRGQEIVDLAIAIVDQEIAAKRHSAVHSRHQHRG